jgi:Na+/citrate or Na+/malate symporter
MRQLKGKTKENAREKKERKKEFLENKDKLFTVALPTFGVLFLMVVVFVYMSSRPKSILD